MLGIAATGFYFKNNTSNDHDKIIKIANAVGLTVKGDGLRIHRKHIDRKNKCSEYVYQMPFGLAFKKVVEHKDVIEDGLNIRLPYINLVDLMKLKFDKTIIKQIKKILKNNKKANKEVEFEFDGMLKVRVYEEELTTQFDWSPDIVKRNYVIPMGMTRKGIAYHDFEKVYNQLIGGATGFGKSTILVSIICSLIESEPDHVKFTLIDLKDGVTFKKFSNCKQTKRFAKNPDEALTHLTEIQNEMETTYKKLFEAGVDNVSKLGIKEREFIIIDEAADIADNAKCMELLKDITRRGRAAGYRIIYATQYPTTETIPSQIKRNFISRVSFVLDTDTASRAVLDEGGAEELPLLPGRGIYKTVRSQVIQAPYVSDEKVDKCIGTHINIRPQGEKKIEPKKGKASGRNSFIVE